MTDGQYIKVTIWDTAGQERFRSITRSYFRNINGVALVFDNASASSLRNAEGWVSTARTEAGEDTPTLLIGNKSDLIGSQVETVSEEEAGSVASKLGLELVTASAKTGHNVRAAFESLIEAVYERMLREGTTSPVDDGKVAVGPGGGPKKGCC
eukprot:TRINITY_DN28233_c0_g1_i1.p1 TRINITY_DN28233_c0_g1~~TRINITY_DN28233_c0_g1_i1.p1  ORF type:complete len:153 (+),score=25.96 TRINITY_DN28233_c0_g1_i1:58-516(+)